jgi:hypothetical protein
MSTTARTRFLAPLLAAAGLSFSGCATTSSQFKQQPDSAFVEGSKNSWTINGDLVAVTEVDHVPVTTGFFRFSPTSGVFISPGQHDLGLALANGDEDKRFLFPHVTATVEANHRYKLQRLSDYNIALVDEAGDARGVKTVANWNVSPEYDTYPIVDPDLMSAEYSDPPYDGPDDDQHGPHGKSGDDHPGGPGGNDHNGNSGGDHHGDPGHPGSPNGGDNHGSPGGSNGGSNHGPAGGSGGHPSGGGSSGGGHSGPPSIPNNPRPPSGGGGGGSSGGGHPSGGGGSSGGGSHSSGGSGGGGGGGSHDSGGKKG